MVTLLHNYITDVDLHMVSYKALYKVLQWLRDWALKADYLHSNLWSHTSLVALGKWKSQFS